MYVNSIDIEKLVDSLTNHLMTTLNIDRRDEGILHAEINDNIQSTLNNIEQNKLLAEKVGPSMWEYLHY
jgi:hypothetical protein